MATENADTKDESDFASFLASTRPKTNVELSEELKKLVTAVKDTGKSGSLTLTISIKPVDGSTEVLAVHDVIKSLDPGSWHPAVWHDVNRMLTLNGEQARRNVEMHICPLQFDIVDRLIERYSNPGDLVFDPFGGLFTVPLRALKAGRRGRGVELNPGYFHDGVGYLREHDRRHELPSLFDLVDLESAS